MNRRAIKVIEAAGWTYVATKGDHWQFRHPTLPGRVTVPHPKRDLPIGTLVSIEKQSGVKLRYAMTSYIALVRKDAGSDYGVDFPDFPGCVTAGKTLDDARRMAAEAIALHLEGMQEDGAAIPELSTLDAVMLDNLNREAVAILLDVAATDAKAVRVDIMLPGDLVAEIDRTTRNRSRFLAGAARAKLTA